MATRALLAVVLSIVALPASALSASPVAQIAPLQEITGGQNSSGICGNVVVHANAAIAAARRNDASIASALMRLRGVDFDTLNGARRVAMTEIGNSASDIPGGAQRTADEVRRLRAFTTNPAGTDRRVEIAAFSDALDAVTAGQRSVADKLAGFVSTIDVHDLRESIRIASSARITDPDDPDTFHTQGRAPTSLSTPIAVAFHATSSTIAARTQAADLEASLAQIATDEARAASHSEAAVGGC